MDLGTGTAITRIYPQLITRSFVFSSLCLQSTAEKILVGGRRSWRAQGFPTDHPDRLEPTIPLAVSGLSYVSLDPCSKSGIKILVVPDTRLILLDRGES